MGGVETSALRAADALRAPYVLGDTQVFRSLFTGVGLSDVTVKTHQLT